MGRGGGRRVGTTFCNLWGMMEELGRQRGSRQTGRQMADTQIEAEWSLI